MRTRALFAGVAVAFLAAPLVTSAATVSELQAQIASLLAQIQAIQAQIQPQATSSAGVSGSASGSMAVYCPSFPRSLSFGSRGDDVSSLQQYLSSQGYFSGAATGYFGAMTRLALGRWQSDNGITISNGIGFGVFGPMSRSYFARFCRGDQNKQSFSADPRSGPAPLAVTFTTSDSIVNASTTYSVDFGDGTSSVMTKGSCIGITAIQGGQGGIRCSYTVTHTYISNGTYTAKLMKNTCPQGAMCFVGPMTVGTATITVGATSTASSTIQRLNAPGTVTLQQGGVAEIRNESYYFTLTNLSSATATIQVTPVGCWNSFPSDPTPQIRCMIAIYPIAPITLSIGQTASNYPITLSQISGASATFSVGVRSSY